MDCLLNHEIERQHNPAGRGRVDAASQVQWLGVFSSSDGEDAFKPASGCVMLRVRLGYDVTIFMMAYEIPHVNNKLN